MTIALIYHDIAARGEEDRYGFPGAAAARFKLDPGKFEAHLDAIAAAGVTVGSIAQQASTALTFDDGGASLSRVAAAIERRGWLGHFFIVTGRVGTAGFLSADEVRELARRGHEVGSHSHSHPTYMGTLTAPELAREWRSSRDALGEILGEAPDTAAVPGGFVSGAVIDEAARAGYRLLLTSQPVRRPSWHDGLLVHGRFTIWSATTPTRAAAYARGDWLACASLWLAWHSKTAPKRVSPAAYEAVRQRWAQLRARPR